MSDKATARTGRCLCGAVRFTATALQTEFGACHCKMCQRWSGAVFMATTVPDDAITIEGREHIGVYQSSDWAERAWCTRCGSNLWYRITTEGPHAGNYEIAVGLFDDATGMRLTREIFIEEKPAAYDFAGDHPRETWEELRTRLGLTTAEGS